LVDARRRTAVRDRVLDESVWAFSQGAADVGLGLVLLTDGRRHGIGRFSVGELAVFSAYLGWLSFLPRMVGRMLARRKQVAVAFDRMSVLVADTESSNTVTIRHLPIGMRQNGNVHSRPTRSRPLERIEVRASRDYPTGAGMHDVSFSVRRGSFVVLTGPIGSGKSTLLASHARPCPSAPCHGRGRWNGSRSPIRAAFLIPRTPRSCHRCRN
jgi:ABC-type multidrug transport system fused ATPase/permease subunit